MDSTHSTPTKSTNLNSTPPFTPLTSAFLRPDSTVEDLTASLSSITRRVSNGTPAPQSSDGWNEERKELETELLVCAEIGQALLHRHEAYVEKAEKEMLALRNNSSEGGNLLLEVNAKLGLVQKDNENLLSKLATSTRENAQLERRLLQSLTSLTLSDSSIATLRAELSSVRGALSKQAGAQARSTGWEDKLREAQKEKDEVREELLAERKLRIDSERKLKKAEDQIASLESKLNAAKRDVDNANQLREYAAKNIVEDASTRIEMIRSELDASGSTNNEVQAVLDGLMTENIHLKRDNGELQELLSEYRRSFTLSPIIPSLSHHDQLNYFDEHPTDLDEGNISRSSTAFFSDELAASTNSRPTFDRVLSDGAQHTRKDSWAPLRSVNTKPWDGYSRQHGRNDSWTPSITPSFASSSYGQGGGLMSPRFTEEGEVEGLGLGNTQGKSGVYALKSSGGSSGRRVRGGSGSESWARGHIKRSFSLDGPRSFQKTFSGVESIAERPQTDDEQIGTDIEREDEPYIASPSRRSSVPASVPSISKKTRHSLGADEAGFLANSPEKVKIRQRPMMLLSRSKAVQTDFAEVGTSTSEPPSETPIHPPAVLRHTSRISISPSVSTNASTEPGLFSPLAPDSAVSSPVLPAYTSQGGTSDTASLHHDPRTTALVSLIDHMSRLLGRVSQSDVSTLTKRLKRQHLPGDVGHLSKSTINAILAEVSELRNHFRTVLDLERRAERAPRETDDPESQVTRKDFLLLVKLFKDIFTELSSLRGTVNDVILDPSSAVKLRESVLYDEEEDAGGRLRVKPARQTSGLGWISPIQKFFVTPPVESSEADPSSHNGTPTPRNGLSGPDRNKLYPSKAAPKLAAATASTVTTVNVEFGGSGVVRRATSTTLANPQFPPSPNGTISKAHRPNPDSPDPSSASSSQQSLSIPTEESTLRSSSPTRVAVNREHLRGIFAGATPSTPPTSWVMVPGNGPAGLLSRPGPKLRSTSSQVFRPSVTPKDHHSFGGRAADRSSNQPLSTALDAVLDPSFNLPIVEKTLRPTRSDESIRSTFIGVRPSPNMRVVSASRVAAPASTTQSSSSSYYKPTTMFAGLTKRIQAFTEASSLSMPTSIPSLAEHRGGSDPSSVSSSPSKHQLSSSPRDA